MTNLKSIGEQVDETIYTLPPWTNLSDFVGEFQIIWRKLGEKIQQQLVQAKIEQTEAQYRGARTKREKRYYTPLGEMVIKRRAYSTPSGIEVKVDQELGLPSGKWLPQVLELASALGVSSEFPNAHKLFKQWTGIEITEKTLANQVEAAGQRLQEAEEAREIGKVQPRENSSTTLEREKPERLYVGVDGVMTPLNQQLGYKEAKVGVIFWSKDHQKIKGKRGVIRQREYVATLKSRGEFRNRVCQLYHQVIEQQTPQTVVIGDGAHWIWEMAQEQFPGERGNSRLFSPVRIYLGSSQSSLPQPGSDSERLGKQTTATTQKVPGATSSEKLSSI